MFDRRKIRIRAMQSLYAFYTQRNCTTPPWDESEALTLLMRGLSDDLESIRTTCLGYWKLLLYWATLARKDKAPIMAALHNNPLLKQLQHHPTFKSLVARYPSSWPKDLLALWYYDYAKELQQTSVQNWAQALKGTLKMIMAHKPLQDHVIMECISWPIYQQSVQKELVSFVGKFAKHDPKAFAFYSDDLLRDQGAFYTSLVTKVLEQDNVHQEMIAKHAQHWAADRIFPLDFILLRMGLTEGFHMPDVPKGVIINEYVELAKSYSTQDSHRFVHGLLDALIQR